MRKLTFEDTPEYIGDDELVEIAPFSIRLRKKVLDHNMRKQVFFQAKIFSAVNCGLEMRNSNHSLGNR